MEVFILSNYPVDFDGIARYNTKVTPNTVHTWGTYNVEFYKRYLLTKAMSVFEWTIPKEWSLDYFKSCIYVNGAICVINTNRFGVIPQVFTPAGYDIYYEPNTAYIASPILGDYMLEIGKQCEVIKLKRDWCGIMDIVNNYAELLAECDKSIGINLLNTKVAFAFGVNSKAEAEKMKKIYDEIISGNPAVFYKDGGEKWDFFIQNLKQNYIVQDLITAKKSIMDEFNTFVGIPNANTEKRERLVKDEVNANNVDTFSLAEEWLEELKIGCEKVNKMFGLNLSVEFREGVKQNGENNTVGSSE